VTECGQPIVQSHALRIAFGRICITPTSFPKESSDCLLLFWGLDRPYARYLFYDIAESIAGS